MTTEPPDDPPDGGRRARIPHERLPEGFARALDRPPPDPAPALPAATVVLMRDGRPGLEVLLLRRVRSSGFVPGAFVFPGGRVDAADASPAVAARVHGLDEEAAARRLGLAPGADPPALAYYVAALREAFEETGLLVGRSGGGAPACAASDPAVRALLRELLEDGSRLPSVLDRLGCRLDAGAVAYVGHWITPLSEPRRYDTRFFAAAVPPDRDVEIHAAEASHALWLTPAAALERSAAGTLPMVFPTLHTLESLASLGSTGAVLEAFRERDIPTILPRLRSTPRGIELELE